MRTITSCRLCDSTKLTEILNLGEQYVSDFRPDDSKPGKYPIEAVICEDCLLVQLRHTTPPHEMYHDNYGFKSGVSDSIKEDLQSVIVNALEYKPVIGSWLDIASNDGTLLSYLGKEVYRVGVDPVTFLCEEAKQHASEIVNDFFNKDSVSRKFDVISAISCFYDMDDPNTFVADTKNALADDGIWIIQQNYLLPTMQFNAVDNFCHEHLEYYTLLSLEKLLDRHDLEVIEVSTSIVNGGSLRTVVAHRGVFNPKPNVQLQRDVELAAGLDTLEPYLTFGAGIKQQLAELEKLVKDLVADGKTVYILAASTRGATIWQGANLDHTTIPYAIERNPAKVGKYFSAVGVPIISEEQARKDKPDYMLVGPWFFAPEIITREKDYLTAGGHFILPLPTLEII